ncbi:hypothetical protein NQ317_007367 [Molorchus minor]|uniref:Uncharacterized protein n=1 Tax=Molorchus minor TaxID=1323400 RepID=A0ABQ9JCW1_9CUCU|nr:hypothetical protein NQ317_007367 [Molorchus minor]
METPTLSKKQKKLTLSAKKSRPKETIKNVLATPYSSYWPKIAAEDHGNLKLILEKNLPKVCEKVQIAWRDMQNIPKADRKSLEMNIEKIII